LILIRRWQAIGFCSSVTAVPESSISSCIDFCCRARTSKLCKCHFNLVLDFHLFCDWLLQLGTFSGTIVILVGGHHAEF
jgi:hypothetical protein